MEELRQRFDAFDPDALVENESFVDAVMTATQTAFRTSQQEKIEVLRNAVLNSAIPDAPEPDIQQLCLELIDKLTPTHLRLLVLLNDPRGWFGQHPELTRPQFAMSSNRSQLITAALPDLGAKGHAIIERFYAALTDGGLVNGALQGMMTADGAWQAVTTDHGKAFLAFVRDPRQACRGGCTDHASAKPLTGPLELNADSAASHSGPCMAQDREPVRR
ncbi:hypothetical protein [Nonomuraea endophytica]|uniref:hypothetical protein n=1 Tax=Nonomuraea endophytica TaxID=714136 RepID=UPI0037CA6DBF